MLKLTPQEEKLIEDIRNLHPKHGNLVFLTVFYVNDALHRHELIERRVSGMVETKGKIRQSRHIEHKHGLE
jgi:hypothetical protein